MPAIVEKIDAVAELLKERAVAMQVVKWPEIFRICDDFKEEIEADVGDYAGCVFRTFEAAARQLCDFDTAIYTSLIATPKKGFFSLHTLQTRAFFRFIANGLSEHDLVDDAQHHEKAAAIAECERYRVWNHAARNLR